MAPGAWPLAYGRPPGPGTVRHLLVGSSRSPPRPGGPTDRDSVVCGYFFFGLTFWAKKVETFVNGTLSVTIANPGFIPSTSEEELAINPDSLSLLWSDLRLYRRVLIVAEAQALADYMYTKSQDWQRSTPSVTLFSLATTMPLDKFSRRLVLHMGQQWRCATDKALFGKKRFWGMLTSVHCLWCVPRQPSPSMSLCSQEGPFPLATYQHREPKRQSSCAPSLPPVSCHVPEPCPGKGAIGP
jgi:hypothetical protein